jgi:hypothetical protein
MTCKLEEKKDDLGDLVFLSYSSLILDKNISVQQIALGCNNRFPDGTVEKVSNYLRGELRKYLKEGESLWV